jgi:poly-gamma-glutamate synthesis protein (capsule biosynthesis protein)
MERLTEELNANWLWHGVGTQKTARVQTFKIKGREIKVAFANIYMAQGDCTYVTCQTDELTVLRSLRDADADLRILSIHSWTKETQKQLLNTGVKFIKYYNGDIVFGHGPHHVEPVRVVESLNGKKGVMFESLGNFIHPSLGSSNNHIIGRVLFDLDTLKLRQVQVVPIAVSRITVSFNSINPLSVPANLTWKNLEDSTWKSGVNSRVRGAYSNIK